jgi:L-amino acid N-acyltransferase YncA
VLARISDDNEPSVRLFRRAGFVSVWVLREVGVKFGKTLDVNLMQLIFGKMDIKR